MASSVSWKQFRYVSVDANGIAAGKTIVDPDVAALRPSEYFEFVLKGCDAGVYFRIVLSK
jgi:hypothetical protein